MAVKARETAETSLGERSVLYRKEYLLSLCSLHAECRVLRKSNRKGGKMR